MTTQSDDWRASADARMKAERLSRDVLAAFRQPLGITHRDGVPWPEAPRPRRWHRCTPQTEGTIGELGDLVQRCACGATRLNNRDWFDRNSRRR